MFQASKPHHFRIFRHPTILAAVVIMLAITSRESMLASSGTGYRISVKTQSQFSLAMNRISAGDTLSIQLAPGTYYISSAVKAKAPLRITGRRAVIKQIDDCYRIEEASRTENGFYVCRLKSEIPPFSLFIDKDDNIIPISESVDKRTHVNTCQDIEGEFSQKTGCEVRIPLTPNINSSNLTESTRAYGYFDCGWTAADFKVKKIKEDSLIGSTLNTLNTGCFNYEKVAYRDDIRYVLYNVTKSSGHIYYDRDYIYIPECYKTVYILKNTTFSGYNPTLSSMSDIELDGITFKNFNGININSGPSSSCRIRNCTFINTLGYALKVYKKKGSHLRPCLVKNCAFTSCSLVSSNAVHLLSDITDATCIYFINCTLNRYGDEPLMYKNPEACILVSGNAEIGGCTVYNTPRCHLYLNRGHITIKDNVLYNTEGFNAHKERNLSNDFGLIYCNHFTSDTQTAIDNTDNIILIEDCLLHGAEAHANDARGIMIDDGRGDVSCRRNVIYDTGLYSIDSRECARFIGSSSVRNLLENNVLAVRYRLEGGTQLSPFDKPISRGNVILTDTGNIVSSADIQKDDIIKKGWARCVIKRKLKLYY